MAFNADVSSSLFSLARRQRKRSQRKRDAVARRGRYSLGRLLSVEQFEPRTLLAADVFIGAVDNTSSYSRVVTGSVATYTPVLSPAEISSTNFINDFGQNLDVVVNTQNGTFLDPGDITFTGLLFNNVGGIHSLTLQADRDINVDASVSTVGSGVGTTLVLNADRDADSDGRVAIVGATNRIDVGAGDLIIGGGLDPLVTPAVGRAGAPQGVLIDASLQATDTGSVSIRGQGGGTTDDNATGVLLFGSIATLDGAIFVQGTAGVTTGVDSDGVRFEASSFVTTDRGAVEITGAANGSTRDNDGVFIRSLISSTATSGVVGAITINGTSNSSTGEESTGVTLDTGTINVGNAAVSLIGRTTTTGNGAGNDGVRLAGRVESTGTALTGAVGGITIDGQSDSSNDSPQPVTRAVSLIAAFLQSADASIQIIGDALGPSGNGKGDGVQIISFSTVTTSNINIAGTIDITGTGARSGNGIEISNASVGSLESPVTLTGTGHNTNGIVVFGEVQANSLTINGTSLTTTLEQSGDGVFIGGTVTSNTDLHVTGSSVLSTGIAIIEGAMSAIGFASFTSTGPLQLVRAQVTAGLAITFDNIDIARNDDFISVSESTINANTGDIFFTAGDSVVIDSTSSITGNNLTINVDNVADADIGIGGGVNLQGTYILSGNANIIGGADQDFLVAIPGITSSIDGGANSNPDLPDFVNVDALGADLNVTTNQLSITPVGPGTSTVASFTNVGIVNAFNVRDADVSGDNTDNLMILNGSMISIGTFTGNTSFLVQFQTALTGSLAIDGLGGNDALLIDFELGLPQGNISFNGGTNSSTNPGDQIFIESSLFPVDSLEFNYINNNDGSIVFDGTSTINYVGVEPITSSLATANVTLNFSTSDETISVTQTSNNVTVDSTVGELTTFVAPTENLIINTGGGTDLVTVNGVNLTLTGAFEVNDSSLPIDDTVQFITTPSRVVNGGVDIASLNIDINTNLNVDGDINLGRGSNAGFIRTNNATITSLGEVVFDERLNVVGTTTVMTDNDSLIGFHFPVDGPEGLTVTGGTGVEFLQVNGIVTPLANLTVTATAGSIRLDDVTTTGDQIYNSPVVTNAGGGTVTLIGNSIALASSIVNDSAMADDLVIDVATTVTLGGDVGGPSNAFNIIDITSPFGLNFGQTMNAIDSIFLSTVDGLTAGQNIITSSSANFFAPNEIRIDAGDDVSIAAGVSIQTSLLNINADADSSDPDTLGANVSVLGTISATMTSIATGDNADTFSIRPQSTTAFDLRANAPSVAPGDSMTIDGGGALDVTIDVATRAITVSGALPVTTVGLESLTLANIATLTVDGTSTFDLITVAAGANAGEDQLTFNGNSPIRLTNVANLVINGLGGDDFFGYDARTQAITTPVTFNGGVQDNTTGGDTLRVDGTFITQVLNYSAPGTEGNNGDLVLDGTTVIYTGLEPIVAGNSVDTILNFNTGAANNATLRDNSSAGVIEIVDNGATFEDTQFPNPTNSLTINLGSGGDTLTVEALDAAYAASMTITSVLGLGDVQFIGTTISNTPGRGLDVVGVATLGITNSTFSNNTADVGAGLRVVSAGANTATTIDSSTFTNNVATGDLATQGGGAIFVDGGDLIIRNNTVISGNRATGFAGSGGGILFASSETLTVRDSTISNNEANRAGGGIDVQGNLANLTNTTIQGNVAGVVAAPGNGGGVHLTSGNLTITGGSISGNTAAAEGGGLWNANVNLTISGGAVISGNFANGDLDPAGAFVDLQGGGGIFNDGGTLVITDVGGAVEISGNFATGTTFGSGGGILSTGGSVTITGARISNNAAVRAGGGLEIVEGNVLMTNSTIDANFVATQSPITANPGNGGGLHITGLATVTIDGGNVTNNIAEAEGGGLWNSATGQLTITGQNNAVLISGNIARGDAAPGAGGTDVQGGGGIFNNGGTLTLDGDRVTKNINISGNAASGSTNGSGGGVLTIGGTVGMNGVSIDGNEAVRAGGGIEIVAGTVTISQSNINDNDLSSTDLLGLGLGATAGNGGGLHISSAATVDIDGSTIDGNVAESEGGGLWNSLTGTLNLIESSDNTVISNNIARGNADPTGDTALLQGGGGVFNNGGALIFVNQSSSNTITISANAATGTNFGSGGGILSIAGAVDLQDVEINGNESVRSGGGVEVVNGTFTMVGGQITGNDVSAADLLGLGLGASPGNGGGLHVTGNASVTVTSASITSNVAGREGGGLWNNTGTMTIFGTTLIEDNVANGDAADDGGGGIFNNGGNLIVAPEISGSPTIANNIASGLLGSGGGIFNGVGGTLQVTGATISNNVANRAGGGIEDASGAGFTLILDGVTMADNNAGVSPAVGAPGNGGGLHVTGAANVRISGGTYSGNTAASEGGALWNGTGTMTIELGTVIDGNTASGNAADDGGGGIFNNGGTLQLTDGSVVISNNIADGTLGSGGGIFNNTGGTVLITGSTISGNRANRAGGGIEDASGVGFGITFTGGLIADNLAGIAPAVPAPGIGGGLNVTGGSNVTLDGTRVAGNIAATEGGGLNNGSGIMRILNGAIIETNQSRGNNSGDGGGGIFNDQGTLTVEGGSTFIRNNSATGQFGIGGGIASRRGSVSITDATLRDNTANGDGGGVIVRGPGATVNLSRAFILDNIAEDSGGGAFFSGASVTVTNTLVSGNIARGTGLLDGIGGGLFLGGDDTSADFLISNSTFSSNDADGAGGGVYVLDASGALTNSGLLSNRVTGAGTSFDQGGGGIAVVSVTALVDVSITDSSVTSNQSAAAAGIAIVDAMVTVSNSTISDNVAGAVGAGGIGVIVSAPIVGNALELDNSRVRNNTTTGEGGGIGVVNASILVNSSTINDNQATGGRGGGIGAIGQGSDETITLRASTLFANTSSLSGGGVALQNVGLDFENVTLSGNSAGTTGGGLAYDNSNNALTRQIQFTTFASNLATNGGENIGGTGTIPIDVRATIIADGSVAATGLLNSLGNNLESGNTSGFNQPTDFLNTDPLLGALSDNGGPVLTHAISFGSAAIDAGGSSGPATDARGFNRPNDGDGDGVASFDIGALEGEMLIALFVDDVTVNENAGTATITVRLPNAAPGAFTVSFSTSNGTATQPGDYTTASGTLTFAGTAGETQSFTVPIIDDNLVESSESVLISLSNPSNSSIEASDTAVLTIIDNDALAALTVADVTVNEAAGTATVTVTLNNALSGPFTVSFATADGTATLPGDYTTASGTLNFAGTAGESQTFTVPIINDNVVEAAETILVSLSNPSNSNVDVSDTAVVTITDNDNAALTVDDVTVNEAAGTATVTVSVNNAVQGGFTVNFATADGTAAAPTDYASASGTLTFVGTAGETRSFTVPIVDDAVIESSESFIVALSNMSVATIDANSTGTVTIVDNDSSQNADLAVSLVGVPTAVQVNGTVVYTTVVSNSGPSASTSVVSTTTLPAGVTIQSAVASAGVVSNSAGVVTVDIGSLNAGSSVTIDITVVVGSTPGTVNVSSSVASSNDPVLSNNADSTSTSVIAQATTDLALVATGGDRFFSGSTGQVNFLLVNRSTNIASNVVSLFTLDPNVTFVSGTVSAGTVTFLPASNQVRVQTPSIAANTTEFITLTVSASNNLPNGSTLTTVGTVSSTETDSNLSDNSVTSTTSVTSARTLSTGADDGGVMLTVDVFGSMGSQTFGGLSQFNPVGPIDAAETVFEAGVLLGQIPNSTRQILTSGGFGSVNGISSGEFSLLSDLTGSDTRVTSSFSIGALRFDLVQELLTTLDASGTVIGSVLTQTYTVTNMDSSATSFDLVRFLDGDLEFDGRISDSGGLRRTASGDELLFVTASNLVQGAATTFVGISATGGTALTDDRFQIDDYLSLESLVIAGSPLAGTIQGDLNGDALVDVGQEYDVSLALRNFFLLSAGASANYVTRTFFGSGPIEDISSPPSSITGHVFCDANGSGLEESGESQRNVTVFVDRNGNRVLDANELSTLTDSSGDFRFTNVPGGAVTVAVVVPDLCNTIPRNVGIARTSLDAGELARSIATVDLDGDLDMDLVVASDLSNSITIFENDGGAFSTRETVTLSDRPQAVSAWSPGSGSSDSVIAVAGFGTPSNKGTVFKITDSVTESFKAGDGPIALVVDDFNGDSIADIVSVASRSSDLSLTLGTASTGSGSSSIGVSRLLAGVRNIRAVIAGDFDGDGNVDIAAAGLGFSADANSELRILLGRGDGTFEPAISRSGDREVVDLIATDLNGDGGDELLTLSANGQLKTYRLSSRVLSQIAQTDVSVGASSFAVGDFNGDAMTDVAVANLGDEIIELFVGDRTGAFFVKSTVTNVTAPSDLVVADFDGDGKAEIAVANFYKQLPEIVTDQTPRNKLPSTLTIIKLNIAEQAVMVSSESTSTVNVTFPSANPTTILDVNRDSFVSAVDALEVISTMRQNDLALLTSGEGEQSTPHKAGKVVFRAQRRVAADVNGDGRTSALDALMVINYINQQQTEQLLGVSGESFPLPLLAYDSPRQLGVDEDKKRTAVIDAIFAGGLF